MNERSIICRFADGTSAYVRSMTVQDRYEYLLEGTRSALTRARIPDILERKSVIDSLVEQGCPCGEFVYEPELGPEFWGNVHVGSCINEYMVTTRFQADGGDDCLELSVDWDASKEDLINLGKALEKVTGTIEFRKYCKHIDWEELG